MDLPAALAASPPPTGGRVVIAIPDGTRPVAVARALDALRDHLPGNRARGGDRQMGTEPPTLPQAGVLPAAYCAPPGGGGRVVAPGGGVAGGSYVVRWRRSRRRSMTPDVNLPHRWIVPQTGFHCLHHRTA